MKKSVISGFLLILLKIVLYGGIILLFFLPKLYDIFSGTEVTPFFEHNIIYQIAFYSCYVIGLGIIYVLIRILKDVYLESPFKKEMERNLKKIAVFFMVLTIIIALKCIFIPTILSAAIVVVTFIASLSFYVLSQVFKMAIDYKHEIDYTV